MASLIAQFLKNGLQSRRLWFGSWVRKIPWRRDRILTPVFLGFPGGPAGKESAFSIGDPGSIPGLERFPGEGKAYPLLYSCLYSLWGCRVGQTEGLSLSFILVIFQVVELTVSFLLTHSLDLSLGSLRSPSLCVGCPSFKDNLPGTSLVVLWLRVWVPMQGVWVHSLVRELRSHMPHSQKTGT